MHKHARIEAFAIIELLVPLSLATANAKWLDKTHPNLPFGVYMQRLQGSVVLSLTLNSSGRVTSTSILRSSGHPALDELARNAAMNWRLSADSVLPTDISKGRVELSTVKNPKPPNQPRTGTQPFWTWW